MKKIQPFFFKLLLAKYELEWEYGNSESHSHNRKSLYSWNKTFTGLSQPKLMKEVVTGKKLEKASLSDGILQDGWRHQFMGGTSPHPKLLSLEESLLMLGNHSKPQCSQGEARRPQGNIFKIRNCHQKYISRIKMLKWRVFFLYKNT